MGLMVGVAAAPCAGALVSGIAIEIARIGSVPVGLLVFTTIGVGIGLPFVAIGAFSTGAKVLPKSGGWLKTVKAVLGLVVLWIAADYLFKGLGFKPDEARTMIGWTVFFAGAAIYLFAFDNSGNTRLIFGIKGAAILALGLLAGQAWNSYGQIKKDQELAALAAKSGQKVAPTKVTWIKYTPEAFEEAKKSGKPILIDSTADWCAVCKEIDEAVFKQPPSIIALQNVVTLKIDLSTGVDPNYDKSVRKQFNIVGLPQVMLFKPGGELARKFMDLKQLPNPQVLLDALKDATTL
jgi:thiol:disulfide interchange protein DsbD